MPPYLSPFDETNKQILCFSPRDGHNNYVKIYKGSGCSSQVGMNGGEQGISLVGTVGTAGCWHQHPIVHEFIHAFGFYHEHMRADRHDYVEIIWKDIPEGLWYLFDKIAGTVKMCDLTPTIDADFYLPF